MKTQIRTWSNNQKIQVPKDLLQDARISPNEISDISVSDGAITLKKTFQHRTLEERASEYGGNLNLDSEYNWGEPIGEEVW